MLVASPIFGQSVAIAAFARVSGAAQQLCTARAQGSSDIEAMSQIMFNFSPALTPEEQKAAIAEANRTCPPKLSSFRVTSQIPTAFAPSTPSVIAPATTPNVAITPPDSGPNFVPAPAPAGMSKGAKVAIGVGIAAVGVGILAWLLK